MFWGSVPVFVSGSIGLHANAKRPDCQLAHPRLLPPQVRAELAAFLERRTALDRACHDVLTAQERDRDQHLTDAHVDQRIRWGGWGGLGWLGWVAAVLCGVAQAAANARRPR
jgi:hypothetical protein